MTWLHRRNRKRRRRGATLVCVDTLEQRALLTSYLQPGGDADVFLRNGDLIIENSQDTVVSVEDGQIHVRSGNTRATVNGGADFSMDLEDFTGDIIVVDGSFFTARGFTPPGSVFVGSETTGVVRLSGMTITDDLEVASASQLNMVGVRILGSARLRTSRAFTWSGLRSVSIGGDLIVTGTPREDGFYMKEGVVHGRTLIRTFGGEDRVRLQDMQFEGPVTVNTGTGDDAITLLQNEFAKRLVVNGGGHADAISSTTDSFSGRTRLRGGAGDDSFSIDEPTVWGTDDFFSRFEIFGEEGADTYEMSNARVTDDRYSVAARRSVLEPQTPDEALAITLANSAYTTSGGVPIGLTHLRDRTYLIAYPARAAGFFDAGRPQVLVNLATGVAELQDPDGGRGRPVNFTDVGLDADWTENRPN